MAGPTTTAMSTRMVGTVFDTATTALATQCLTDAQNEINKRLTKRYDLDASPFLTTTSYPPQYTTMIEMLAIGYMYENLSRGGKDAYSRADRYIDKVMDNIDDLLEGAAQLVDSSGAAITESDNEWQVQTTEDYAKTFNEDDPDSWEVSQDKLDAIESERDE